MRAVRQLSWAEVCARRLARHGLSAPAAGTAAEVASAICGAHAQVAAAAEHSLALRLAGATRSTISEALWTERTLVRTFGPRGTVHVLASADLPLWTAALPAIPRAGSGHAPDVRLTAAQADAVVQAIGEALADDELTVEELGAAVVARTGPWAGDLVMPAFAGHWPRWRQALGLAGQCGALCFGPGRGRQVTYTSPQRWLPGLRPLAAERAVAEVVRRYLWAYGPATPAHLAQWLAARPGWAEAQFTALGDELEPVDVEGGRAWQLAADQGASGGPPSGVRLLPYFDAYVVGSHPRGLLFPGRAATRALTPAGQAGNYPVLLVDGVAAGVWHAKRAGRRVDLTVEPLRRLSAARLRELAEAVERTGAILVAEPRLAIGPVTVGAHA